MIKAKHHRVIYPLFKNITRILLKRNFSSITVEGKFKDDGNPVLVIANHISWWDGFWIAYLNLRIIHRKFHFMIREEQLNRHWYFKYLGGYSVMKKTRSIMESLNYTIQLLEQERNMVLMFPQGQINSLFNNSINFEKGIERIIKSCTPDLQILFVANFPDYFSDYKPNLFIYIKRLSAKCFEKNTVEYEYNKFYTRVIGIQKNKVS